MKKIINQQSKHNQKIMLFHSIFILLHTDSEKLLWHNSPLLVLLQCFPGNELEALQEEGGPLCSTSWPFLQTLVTTQEPTKTSLF
jgi:hypothetical protein